MGQKPFIDSVPRALKPFAGGEPVDDAAVLDSLLRAASKYTWSAISVLLGSVAVAVALGMLSHRLGRIEYVVAVAAVIVGLGGSIIAESLWKSRRIHRRAYDLFAHRRDRLAHASALIVDHRPFVLFLRNFRAEEDASNSSGWRPHSRGASYHEYPPYTIKRFISDCAQRTPVLEFTAFWESPNARHHLLSIPSFIGKDWMRLVRKYLSAATHVVVHYNGDGGSLGDEIGSVLERRRSVLFVVSEPVWKTGRLVPLIQDCVSAHVIIYDDRGGSGVERTALPVRYRAPDAVSFVPIELSPAWLDRVFLHPPPSHEPKA